MSWTWLTVWHCDAYLKSTLHFLVMLAHRKALSASSWSCSQISSHLCLVEMWTLLLSRDVYINMCSMEFRDRQWSASWADVELDEPTNLGARHAISYPTKPELLLWLDTRFSYSNSWNAWWRSVVSMGLDPTLQNSWLQYCSGPPEKVELADHLTRCCRIYRRLVLLAAIETRRGKFPRLIL